MSARNRFNGVVKNVEKGTVMAKVNVEVKSPINITALISKEAVEELGIKTGENVEVIVKATQVMIAKEE